jgi:hypothetical protein
MADVILTRLEPPANEQPMRDDGAAHTQPWIDYHQSIADRVNTMQSRMRQGVTDGGDATAGQIGEYLVANATVGPVNGVGLAVTSLSLTAGDWDVEGNVYFTFSAAATTLVQAWVGTSAVAAPANGSTGVAALNLVSGVIAAGTMLATGGTRLSLAGTTTVYLGCATSFSTGIASATGTIRARRQR